ncbi:pyruvate dehydrogenase (acetyl-transferring) E1 component subunit alpha [Fulvivirga sp. 29W222]|uniref:Pyruvate dehydrogenase E1 component subunit alpha n=2 Tax=Fulvivirga marina TaxID=2494733 RepID=A0A937G434_9BACT|nr:pyruvate dehydrogenase (acetyl-transferring) E1 component subunit alpha [Fulvivirga marina]
MELLRQMKSIRALEDKAAEMYSKMKIRGFLHLYVGEEAVAVGVMQSLTQDDNVLCTYREHGHALVRGISARKIMAEMYGKQEGCSLGRGGSMHLFDKSKKFFGGNAIVAGHLPLAVGMALADKKQEKGDITACFFGEGAAAEGEFHESLNLATLFEVPVLFVCENNRYAMGTALQYTHHEQNLEKKGVGYGIEATAVDGMNVLAVEKAARKAVKYIRKTGKPYFLVCNTYRYRAHSMFDAELYRTKEEVKEWKKRDPIQTFTDQLLKQGLITEKQIKTMDKEIEKEIDEAVDYAEAGTWEPVEDLEKYVYSK